LKGGTAARSWFPLSYLISSEREMVDCEGTEMVWFEMGLWFA
jgi:hypothetical protein